MAPALALMLFCVTSQPVETPSPSPDDVWRAPAPPDASELESMVGLWIVDEFGSVTLPKVLADWMAGYTNALRGYPGDCQLALLKAKKVTDERRQKAVADVEARLEAALAVQGQDVWTISDKLLWVGVPTVAALAVGIVVGVLVAN